MAITTHVLDTSRGRPAAGVPVALDRHDAGSWTPVGRGVTDTDGRARDLTPAAAVAPGTYRLRFEVAPYFAASGTPAFYPVVEVTFTVRDGAEHHHVPLLLAPHGFSTYRGS